jgi:hypothetical protein
MLEAAHGDSGLFLFLVLIACIMYFLPAIIAGSRHHSNASAITVLNLLLGWTILGWIAAMVWAHTDNVKAPQPRRQWIGPPPEGTYGPTLQELQDQDSRKR